MTSSGLDMPPVQNAFLNRVDLVLDVSSYHWQLVPVVCSMK